MVIAPSLIPRSEQRRTARMQLRWLDCWAPANDDSFGPMNVRKRMQDLVRARAAAVETLRVHRQEVSAFVLKQGRIYLRRNGWAQRCHGLELGRRAALLPSSGMRSGFQRRISRQGRPLAN
uniref:Probable transposase n=1 Tax=Rhizobium loti TaxID=381 RepID=M5ALT1_RHILI|nr:probable transposase [Mesorhizobium loti NZP2037]